MSSLHIGHTSRLEALAAAFSPGPSNTLLPMSSRVSAVLAGLCDVCELSESELAEGDSRLGLRRCRAGGCGEAAGDRLLPLPSTRPPPRDLREAMVRVSGGVVSVHGRDLQPTAWVARAPLQGPLEAAGPPAFWKRGWKRDPGGGTRRLHSRQPQHAVTTPCRVGELPLIDNVSTQRFRRRSPAGLGMTPPAAAQGR